MTQERQDRRYRPAEVRRGRRLAVMLTDAEADAVIERADARGISVSEYLRRGALRGIAGLESAASPTFRR